MSYSVDCQLALCRARGGVTPNESSSTIRAFEEELIGLLRTGPPSRLTVLPHLYDLTEEGAPVDQLQSLAGPLVVLAWLPPRATYWLLRRLGIDGRRGDAEEGPSPAPRTGIAEGTDGAARRIWCVDLRQHAKAETCAEAVRRILARCVGTEETTVVEPGSQKPSRNGPHPDPLPEGETIEQRARWYPVVDYDRCANCLECLNFCLFGVYGLDGSERLVVERPDACRPGCPACARVCPSGAIMFPEHADPIISGEADRPAGRHLGETGLSLPLLGPTVRTRDRGVSGRPNPSVQSAPDTVSGRPAGDVSDLDALVDGLDDLDL